MLQAPVRSWHKAAAASLAFYDWLWHQRPVSLVLELAGSLEEQALARHARLKYERTDLRVTEYSPVRLPSPVQTCTSWPESVLNPG